ncbi:Patatin [Ceratocystis platani]|uniref:Patatin n=1 Tax=Ceratocystis fimbriata f. sp. platani TaxID=88771 RepID=A0A0F8AZ21_CERFI|nr:Patatin [Ceratocystis platani]
MSLTVPKKMSLATQSDGNAQPFKVLSLDDGGIGGLSSLLILENIMENIQDAEDLPDMPKPCDRFDLIGGTGTGGIAAIMLGRLGQRPTRLRTESTSSILTKNLEIVLKKAIRENCPLEQCAREREKGMSTVDTCQHENDKFLDQNCAKTVVPATTKTNIDARPILFRTYRATASLSECKIWEVARATSAMDNLFKPIKLGRDSEKFINSSFGHSNPCKILIQEAAELLSGQQEMLILSNGTGLSSAIEMGNTKRSIGRSLEKIATSSRRVADELEAEHSSKPQRYYRFNTANGQGSIAASDWVEPSKVAAHTKNYLNEKQADIKTFAKVLTNGFSTVAEQPRRLERPDEPEGARRLQEPKKPKTPHGSAPVYYIPFHENLQFVGRQDILSQLDDKLFTRTGFQQVALMGLGGMGKTQVALKFAYTVKNKYADYSIFWLTAASMDGFRNSCKELAAALRIDASDRQDPRILVKNYLDTSICGKWLLVLDNVDDPSLFDAAAKESRIGTFLPQSDNGRIMFTTRSQTVSWLAVKTDSLELEEMSSEELTTILMRSVEVHDDQSHIHDEHPVNELLNELCHLPLAIFKQ